MSRASRRPSQVPNAAANGLETAVTKLLVDTKALLEGLSKWSEGIASDDNISDIYVKLGNDFNECSRAFGKMGVPFSDLLSIPQDLRVCLENCLGEPETSPATLEKHLPSIREIISIMLQGLKVKQLEVKQLQAARQQQLPPVPSPSLPAKVTYPTSSRANEWNQQPPSADSNIQRTKTPPARSSDRASSQTHSRDTSLPINQARQSQSSLTKSQSTSAIASPASSGRAATPPAAAIVGPPVLPAVNFDPAPSTSTPNDARRVENGEAANSSLESLKHSENLMRRASKRFSKYTFQTMATSPSMSSSPSRTDLSGTSPSSGRKVYKSPPSALPSIPPPPLPVSRSAQSLMPPSQDPDSWSLHMEDLDTRESRSRLNEMARRPSDTWNQHMNQLETGPASILGSVDEAEEATPRIGPSANGDLYRSQSSAKSVIVNDQHAGNETGYQSYDTAREDDTRTAGQVDVDTSSPSPLQVYVSLGRETKKAAIELDQGPITIASLRVLFMDRFGFNPGQEDFPAIYIRDVKLGVEYELEDMNDIRENSVISLNIEPLDQIKQHIDTGFGGLTKELKDLRTSVTAAVRRASIPPPRIEQPSAPVRPDPVRSPPMSSTSASFPLSPAISEKMMADLKSYRTEVQQVRRDLAVLRQLQTDYTTQHKSVIANLRSQVEHVKSIAATQAPASRAFVDANKDKLDKDSGDLVTRVNSLGDTLETMKDDVSGRGMRPLQSKLAEIRTEIGATQSELQELRGFMSSIKPAWKQTWSNELQNVVAEENFLKHQEQLLAELGADHEDMVELFGTINEFLQHSDNRRGPGRSLRDYVPAEPADSKEVRPGVMAEITGLAFDSGKRLEALEKAERERKKDIASRKDSANPFSSELGGFVDGKQLKKTGGPQEADRLQRLKSEAALKTLYQGSTTALPDSPGSVAGLAMADMEELYINKDYPSVDEDDAATTDRLFNNAFQAAQNNSANFSFPPSPPGVSNNEEHSDLARLLADSDATFPPLSSTNSILQSYISSARGDELPSFSDFITPGVNLGSSTLPIPGPSTLNSRKGKRSRKQTIPVYDDDNAVIDNVEITPASPPSRPTKRLRSKKDKEPLDVLPSIGRVRLEKRQSTTRTRHIVRPAMPEFLLDYNGDDPIRSKTATSAIKAGASSDFVIQLAKKAAVMRTALTTSIDYLQDELTYAQIEEAILQRLLVNVKERKARLAESPQLY